MGLRPHFAPPPDPLSRTTYVPGQILQIDWWDVSRIRVPVGLGHTRPAFGLVGVLPTRPRTPRSSRPRGPPRTSCSRCRRSSRAWAACRALCVVDRDSSIVNTKTGRVPDELAALLGHLAIRPIVLPPYGPRSRGAVERANGCLKTSFVPLRKVTSLADLEVRHDEWAAKAAWPRNHRRLGVAPETARMTEVAEMAPLSSVWPETSRKLLARVSRDCFVRTPRADERS